MVPLIKKSTDVLVEKVGEKADAEESIEILMYVHDHRVASIANNFLVT